MQNGILRFYNYKLIADLIKYWDYSQFDKTTHKRDHIFGGSVSKGFITLPIKKLMLTDLQTSKLRAHNNSFDIRDCIMYAVRLTSLKQSLSA